MNLKSTLLSNHDNFSVHRYGELTSGVDDSLKERNLFFFFTSTELLRRMKVDIFWVEKKSYRSEIMVKKNDQGQKVFFNFSELADEPIRICEPIA